MLPDRVSNPGPLTYESGVLPIALRGPARSLETNLQAEASNIDGRYSNKPYSRRKDIQDKLQRQCEENKLALAPVQEHLHPKVLDA